MLTWPGWAMLDPEWCSGTQVRGVSMVVGGQLALSQPLVDLGALGEDLGGLRFTLDGLVQRIKRLALASEGGEREANHEIATKVGWDTQA